MTTPDALHVSGSAGNDRIVALRRASGDGGDGGDDTFIGSRGNDRVPGGDGDDKLFGGSGDDHLIGEGQSEPPCGRAIPDQSSASTSRAARSPDRTAPSM